MPHESPFERIDPVRESALAQELMPALKDLDLSNPEYLDNYRQPGWSPAEEQSLQARMKLATGDKKGAGLDLAGLLVALAGAGAGGKGIQKAAGKGKHPSPFVGTRPEISGSKDLLTRIPATVGGKGPAHWGADDMERFGAHFGVEGMGKASKLVDVKDNAGRVHQIPESFLSDGGRPSYWDTLVLKAAGVDPGSLPDKLRDQIHGGMVRAVTPHGGKPTDEHVARGYLFGITSPNNPLTPNELAVARAMPKSEADVDRLTSMVPWNLDQASSVKGGAGNMRVDTWSPQISRLLGLQAGPEGGLGVVGSVDWTRVPDFMAMHRENPAFFRFQGDHTPQSWAEHVQKVASQVPGLSMKTGSLGSTWQHPGDAMISAIDRHMAQLFRGSIMGDPKAQSEWEQKVLGRFNEGRETAGKPQIKTIEEMLQTPGGKGVYNDNVFVKLNNHPDPKFRYASGEINPSMPDFLRNAQWVREPDKVILTSPAYLRALEANRKAAEEGGSGQGIFSKQWGLWDTIRQRFEPHEIMNPDIANIGRMSLDQLKDARKAHSAAGYMSNKKVDEVEGVGAVKKVDNPGGLAMFSIPAGIALASPFLFDDEQERQ